MINNVQKRAKLVENRKEIAEEAAKMAQDIKTDFIIDASFAAGLGASFTTAFNYFGGSQAITIGTAMLAVGCGATVAISHITSTFNQDFYTQMSKQAKREAFEFDQGGDIENQKRMTFDDYDKNFRENYKDNYKGGVKPLITAKSALLAVGLSAAVTFALMQDGEENLRKEEDPQDLIDQGSYRVLVLGT